MSSVKYATTKRTAHTVERKNMNATWRSARFSAFGSTSVGRQTWAGRPGLAIGSAGGSEESTTSGGRS